MLKENNSFNPGDIVSIKLLSGEEIIAKLKEIHQDYVKIINPVSMVLEMVEHEHHDQLTNKIISTSQPVVAFAPFLLGIRDGEVVKISESKYVCIVLAREDAAKQFKEATGIVPITEPPEAKHSHGISGVKSGGFSK